MYVGQKVTQTSHHQDLMSFACAACGHGSVALVVGVGQGQGNSAYFLDNEGAEQRAGTRAASAAVKNAALTLSLAKCPGCGVRNRSAVARFWAKLLAVIVGGMAFIASIGGLLYALDGDDMVLWIFGPCAIGCGVLIAYVEHWKWTTVDGRVHFVDQQVGCVRSRAPGS